MSGGSFDYAYDKVSRFADELEERLDNAGKRVRPDSGRRTRLAILRMRKRSYRGRIRRESVRIMRETVGDLVMDGPSTKDMRSAMSMAAMLLNGATWRKNGTEDKWCMTAIYQDGRVAMTRERDGFSQKFAPHVIAEQFSRRV